MRINRRKMLMLAATPAVAALGQKRPEDPYPDAAPFVPTPPEIAEAMLRLAGTGPRDIVYDLGSGDGRIVVLAAQKFGAKGVGIEIDPDLNVEARDRARRAGVAEKTRFVEGDLFRADLREATVVTMYLLPKTVDRLKPKLLDELKPGTRVVSFSFPISGWTPAKVEELQTRRIYLWIIPARRADNGALPG